MHKNKLYLGFSSLPKNRNNSNAHYIDKHFVAYPLNGTYTAMQNELFLTARRKKLIQILSQINQSSASSMSTFILNSKT